MSYPNNPNTIILKNKYYPKGLREIDVWNYYQKYKSQILKETRNRDLMFFIMVETNKSIIRKKTDQKTYIRLTPDDYDQLISGRTLSIHSTMNQYETIGIIDIDINPGENIARARKATYDVYNFVMDKMSIISSASIRFTGQTSFHIVCEFNRKLNIDSIKHLFETFLKKSELSKIYTIGGKRRAGIINLDLNRNCKGCNFITLFSLSILGLRCIEVPYQSILNFNPSNALLS